MMFEFATAQRIIFGAGTLPQAGAVAAELGRTALVVTGRNPARAEPLLRALRQHGVAAHLLATPEEPTVEFVSSGVVFAQQQACDLVIGFGGGSALDAGKAIAAMLTNPGELLDYLEVIGRGQTLPVAPAPFVAIPTTAGTGSEATRNAVLASGEHKVKVSLRSPLMLPRLALVDPELTYGLPPAATAATGLDALTQLLEAFVCLLGSPLVDALCREGLQRASRSLRAACREPANRAARADMSLAALFGGIALANAGLGAVHGFAGPVGGMFKAPHGAVCAALLAPVCRENIRALRERQPANPALPRYAEAARLLTGEADAQPERGVEFLARLVSDLGVPGLKTYGLRSTDVHAVVEKAMSASSMKPNPVILTRDELAGIMQAAL